jgi:hypothetical protein
MALAFQLSGAGHPPQELRTTAKLRMDQDGAGFKIAAITLSLKARVPASAATNSNASRRRQGRLPRLQGAECGDHVGAELDA